MYSYKIDDLVNALKESGVQKGDIILLYTSMSTLGLPEGVKSQDDLCALCLEAFHTVLGDEGTLAIPTYTYSLGNNEVYDPLSTPCPQLGPLAEYFRKLPNVSRSADPFLSVAVKEPHASALIENISSTSYGKGFFFERLVELRGKIVCLGLDFRWTTFIHYSEEIANVPFRYKKQFTGYSTISNKTKKCSWVYSVRPYLPNVDPDGTRLSKKALDLGLVKHVNVGRGFINTIEAKAYFDFSLKEFKKDPWLSVKGPACDIVFEEEKRVGREMFDFEPLKTLEGLAIALTPLPRNIVSDAYDVSLENIKEQIPLSIYKYHSGTEVYGYIVPEKWTCHKAHLESINGETVFSLNDSILHVSVNSTAFSDIVDKETLLNHIVVDEKNVNRIPYSKQEISKTWALCASSLQKNDLKDENYKVYIDSYFSYGELKLGESVAKGYLDKHIIICATLSGAGQFNKGLSGVLAGISLMKKLQEKANLKYTYTLLILPEIEAFSC